MAAGTTLARGRRRRGHAALALVFTVATVVSFAALVMSGMNRADEVWNLHLIHRMLQGDVLYTDIRYYPTPLALFVGVGAARIFGAQLLMFKALVAVSFGVTATADLVIVRMLLAGRRARAFLVVALLLFALPPASSLYNTLVISFASVTAALVLRWDAASPGPSGALSPVAGPPGAARSRRLFRWSAAVGVAAGACWLTKYNLGAVVAVAVGGSFAVPLIQRRIRPREFLASALTASGAWLLTVVAGMTPVVIQGAGGDFVRQLLDGRSLLGAPVPYRDGWQRLLDGAGRLSTPDIRTLAFYALIPLCGLVGALAIARTRSVVRGRLIIVGLFSLASAALAIPRTDHLIWSLPLPLALLVGSVAQALERWREARPLAEAAVGSLFLAFGITWLVLATILDGVAVRRFEMAPSGYFQGALLPPGQWRDVAQEAAEIGDRIGPDRKVLILRLEAGLYYLAGDLRNPTRYDYPDAFEFGSTGQTELKAALVDRTIRFTCIGRDYPRELEPRQVIATVRAHSRLVAQLRACDLWRTGIDRPTRAP